MLQHLKWYVKTHAGQIAIFAITGVILAGIAVIATGDISTALARGGRH